MNWLSNEAIVFSLTAVLISVGLARAEEHDFASGSANAVKSFAIVELFTSQGCSSCPPADQLLADIANVGAKDGLQVFCLSFHVDYWNRLGWTDPYSNPRNSDRQRSYASAIGSERVYTPQMVVNGTTEFVGSQREKANPAIGKALQQTPAACIALKLEPAWETKTLVVDYQVTGKTQGYVLNFALVHTPKPNRVPRGENEGRELFHINVVRSFKTVPLSNQSGTIELDVPDGVELSTAGVCAYVQHDQTKAIVGATLSSVALRGDVARPAQ